MAEPVIRDNMNWEGNAASIALAGIRPLVQSRVSVNATSEGTYTIVHRSCRRVVVFHASGTDTDIRIELNAAADSTKIPAASGVYIVLEVEQGDVVHVYNTTGGAIFVYFMEIQ